MNDVAMNIQNGSVLWCVVCTSGATSRLSRAFLWLLLPHLSPLPPTQHDLPWASLGGPQPGHCQHRLRGPVSLHPAFDTAAPLIQSSKHFFHIFAGHEHA